MAFCNIEDASTTGYFIARCLDSFKREVELEAVSEQLLTAGDLFHAYAGYDSIYSKSQSSPAWPLPYFFNLCLFDRCTVPARHWSSPGLRSKEGESWPGHLRDGVAECVS